MVLTSSHVDGIEALEAVVDEDELWIDDFVRWILCVDSGGWRRQEIDRLEIFEAMLLAGVSLANNAKPD